jgi:hypothetical protein
MFQNRVFTSCALIVLASLLGSLMQVEASREDAEAGSGDRVYLPLISKSFNCAEVIDISTQECEGLVALHQSTDGANWVYHDNWLTTNQACHWYGVYCTNASLGVFHVGSIIMVDNTLNGPIPADVEKLQFLRVFQSVRSQLRGPIPPELGNLPHLESIILYNNQLTGSIPPELGQLSNLHTLGLGHNQLSGQIPLELGNLSKLRALQLHNNRLSGAVPSTLGNLTRLQALYIYSNELSGPLPQSLTQLHLSGFWFNDTQLCEPPNPTFQAWLASISNLQRTGILCKG